MAQGDDKHFRRSKKEAASGSGLRRLLVPGLLGLLFAVSLAATIYFIFLRTASVPVPVAEPVADGEAVVEQPAAATVEEALPQPPETDQAQAFGDGDTLILPEAEPATGDETALPEEALVQPGQNSSYEPFPFAQEETASGSPPAPETKKKPTSQPQPASQPPPLILDDDAADHSVPQSIPPLVAEPTPAKAAAPPPAGRKPRIAILVDDMGYTKKIGEQLLALDLPLSFSFLPGTPHLRELSRAAEKKGRQVLLHQPMEPKDAKYDTGPGLVRRSMADQEIRAVLTANLALLPMAAGVNNHMGSAFGEDPQKMTALLEELGSRGLFFLDSLTSSGSVGYDTARRLGVKTARRTLFLDNTKSKDAVLRELRRLVAIAEKTGTAVGLCHPHAATLDALREYRNELQRRVELVPVGDLVR